MDTSETYIKMRLAAIPDLGMGLPPEFVGLAECTWINATVYIDHKGDFYYSDEVKACQLERQDQLQEMVKRGNMEFYPHNLLWRFFRFAMGEEDLKIDGWGEVMQYATSMEQLWLAFVMKERWNKVWNGEDWIEA